jgi:glucuronate isomerase
VRALGPLSRHTGSLLARSGAGGLERLGTHPGFHLVVFTADETVWSRGLAPLAGFVDDTRAFCSIPARHDASRRIDAGVLARLVAEHRLGEDEAVETAVALVTTQPTTVFKL